MDPKKATKGTNRPNRQSSNKFKRNMKVKDYPDIAHRNRDIHHITTKYSNMPGGAKKKDSVNYQQGFDAGKVRLADGYTVPGGYYGKKAMDSNVRKSRWFGEKFYRAGYQEGEKARVSHLQNKARNKRNKRNK